MDTLQVMNSVEGRAGRGSALGAGALLIAAIAASTARAEVQFGAGIALNETYVDNIFLSTTGTPKTDEFVTQATPFLTLHQDSGRVHSAIDYSMQNFFYADNNNLNQTNHRLHGALQASIVPDWFGLEGSAGYSQLVADPREAVNVDNIFSTSNIADALSASMTPILRHQFGQTLLNARYTYSRIDFSGKVINPVELDNSKAQTVEAHYGVTDQNSGFFWQFDYLQDRIDYDTSLPYRYELAGARVGVGIGGSWHVIADGGGESDLERSSIAGGLGSSYWRGGLRWNPDERNLLEVTAGRRFFGNTYGLIWNRRARLFDVSVTYDEAPFTESLRIARTPQTPGEPPPPGIDIGRITPEAAVGKMLEGRLRLLGRRNEIALRVYGRETDFITRQDRDRYRGVGLDYRRRLSARTTATLLAASTRSELREGGRATDRLVRLRFSRELSRSFTGRLEAGYLARQGEQIEDYHAAFVTIGIVKSFGVRAAELEGGGIERGQ
jgi:hypothetical protein